MVIIISNRTEWSPILSVIIRVMAKSDSCDLFITSMITDRIGRHEFLLPINHKKYNFREKKNSQVMRERENSHQKTDKGNVNILRPPCLPLAIRWQKHKSKRACTHACTCNYNFKCDWSNVIG